jgi:hypothetical protein
MTYKETLQNLKLIELKKLVSKMLGTLEPEGKSKQDYIDHLLKYTSFNKSTKIIKSKETTIQKKKKEEKDVTGKYDPVPPRRRLIPTSANIESQENKRTIQALTRQRQKEMRKRRIKEFDE